LCHRKLLHSRAMRTFALALAKGSDRASTGEDDCAVRSSRTCTVACVSMVSQCRATIPLEHAKQPTMQMCLDTRHDLSYANQQCWESITRGRDAEPTSVWLSALSMKDVVCIRKITRCQPVMVYSYLACSHPVSTGGQVKPAVQSTYRRSGSSSAGLRGCIRSAAHPQGVVEQPLAAAVRRQGKLGRRVGRGRLQVAADAQRRHARLQLTA
jgi:hypothetical protein